MFMPNLFLMFANSLLAFQDRLKFQQNLNSTPAHNFQKLELLQSYTWSNKVDILCLFEAFPNLDTSCKDVNLQLPGFSLTTADHLSNTRRGQVCIYYRNFLPLKLINAGLKISTYILIYIKMISWKFRIINPKNSWAIHPQRLRKVCLQTYRNNRIR